MSPAVLHHVLRRASMTSLGRGVVLAGNQVAVPELVLSNC